MGTPPAGQLDLRSRLTPDKELPGAGLILAGFNPPPLAASLWSSPLLHHNNHVDQTNDIAALRQECQALHSLTQQLLGRIDAIGRALRPQSDPASLAGMPCDRAVDAIIKAWGPRKASYRATVVHRRLAAERKARRHNGNGHAVAVYDFN
jgi:hypothetical protein